MVSEAAEWSTKLDAYAGNLIIENEHGRAVVSPRAGAALRSLHVIAGGARHELLAGGDGPLEPGALPHGTGSFIMAPWPNRIPGGRLVTPDGEYVLKSGSAVHTIHGLVRDKPWSVDSAGPASCRLTIDIPEPWPWRGRVIYEAGLDGPALIQTLTVESLEHEFPAAVGWHPWFRASLGSGDVAITLDALEAWVLDEEMTPSGVTATPPLVAELRAGAHLAPGSTDDCFRISPGARTTLRWPEATLEIASSDTVNHVMVYAPPDGTAVCVEPQTACVNAFQLHARGVANTGTRHVSPGHPLVASTRWAWR